MALGAVLWIYIIFIFVNMYLSQKLNILRNWGPGCFRTKMSQQSSYILYTVSFRAGVHCLTIEKI